MELIADFAMNYGLFLAKAVTVVIALALAVGWILSLIGQARAERDGDRLSITHVNDRLDRMAETLNATLLNPSERKARAKRRIGRAGRLRELRCNRLRECRIRRLLHLMG